MLNTYFEKYGHSCKFNLNSPLEKILKNKSSPQKWFMIHAVISQNHILLRSHPRSYAALRNEILCQMKYYPYALHPCSVITYYLDLIWMISVFIWCVIRPMDTFEHIHPNLLSTQGTGYVETIMAIICFFDCIRRFFTGYIVTYCDSDEVVLDRKRIGVHYLKSYFFIDFISSLPAFIKLAYRPQPSLKLALVLISFLRIMRLGSIFQIIKNVMKFHQISHNFIDIFIAITNLCFIVHWVACFSVVLGSIERQFDPNIYEWYDGMLSGNFSFIHKYIICCHRTISILTGTGYKLFVENTKSENDMIYTMFTAVLGHVLTVIIFSKIYEIINGMRNSSAKYEEMLSEISSYMNHQHITKLTQNKIKTYYAYKYNYSYFNEYELLATIPSSLRQRILLCNATMFLDNMELFKNLPTSVVANIIAHVAKEIVLAGDVIFRSREESNSMYFLLSGTVALFTYSGREICHLEDESEFGEAAITGNAGKHIFTVQAIETSELFKLHAIDFYALMEYCPDLVEQWDKLATQRKDMADMIEERYQQTYNKYLKLEEQEVAGKDFGRYGSLF